MDNNIKKGSEHNPDKPKSRQAKIPTRPKSRQAKIPTRPKSRQAKIPTSQNLHGRIRRRLDNGISPRVPPLFPPTLWCVYDSIQLGVPRTQNAVEAWHYYYVLLI